MNDDRNIPVFDSHVHLGRIGGFSMVEEVAGPLGMTAINVLCTTLVGKERTPENAAGLLFKSLHPENYFLFGSLYYDDTETPRKVVSPAAHAESLVAAGCDGIKMLEGKPSVYKTIAHTMDAPEYDEYYEFMQSKQVPILFHLADPATFWDPELIPGFAHRQNWDYTDGTYPTKEQLYREVDNLLEKFPDLRIILAHVFFLSQDRERAERFLDAHPTVSFDITPGSEMYRDFSTDPVKWREFFTKYRDRIVFGTDNSGRKDEHYEQRMTSYTRKVKNMRRFLETDDEFEGFGGTMRGLRLDGEVLENIYHGNFQRYVGEGPKPVDVGLAIGECERLIGYSENSPDRDLFIWELNEVMERLKAL